MKRLLYIILFAFSLTLLAIACKEESLMSYEYTSSVYIYKGRGSYDRTRDSVTYSFAIRDEQLQKDTVFVPIRIMGNASTTDRFVNYEVMDISSADPGSYELLPAKIKARQFEGVLPVLVKKTPALKESESRLWIQIVRSDDFLPGVPDQLTYLVKINDFLSKPASWNDYYLGTYSNVKYDLIIKTTGYIAFEDLGNSELRFIAQDCKNALIEYERDHGTALLDENNQLVVFP